MKCYIENKEELWNDSTNGSQKVSEVQDIPPVQHTREESWSIVGADVEALFPSLPDIESGRLVREAVKSSKMKFNGVDYERALVYLRVVGGKDYLLESKLRHIIP